MKNQYHFRFSIFLSTVLMLLILAGIWQFLFIDFALAQVNCPSTQTIKLNDHIVGNTQTTVCFMVEIPALTTTIDVTARTLGPAYDVYWDDGARYVLAASNLQPDETYLLTMPHIFNTSASRHILAIIPRSALSTSKFDGAIYARDKRGEIQYETVGAISGTSSIGTNPRGGSDPRYEVPAKSSVHRYFTARCGVISIDAQWLPWNNPSAILRNFRVNLYAPNGQRVHSIPVGTIEGFAFSLDYPISPEQIAGSTRWMVEFTNGNTKPFTVEMKTLSSTNDCPILVQPPTPTVTAIQTLTRTPTAEPLSPATPVTTQTGQVTADDLNVRSGAGINFTSVGRLTRSTVVQIVGTSENGLWYQLEDGNWVSAQFISIIDTPMVEIKRLAFQQGQLPTSAYSGESDISLEQGMPISNQGNAPQCYVDGDDPPQSNLDRVALLKWEINSIPKVSIVKSVWITLQVTNETAHTYSVYEIRRDWAEEQATWQQSSNGSAWNIEGAMGSGDRNSVVVGSLGPVGLGIQIIRLNGNGIALVQGWVDGTIPNYGLSIANASSTDGVDFHCSEATHPTLRPALTIEYAEN